MLTKLINWFKRGDCKHDFVVLECSRYIDTSWQSRLPSTHYSAYCKHCGKQVAGHIYGVVISSEQLKLALDITGKPIQGV